MLRATTITHGVHADRVRPRTCSSRTLQRLTSSKVSGECKGIGLPKYGKNFVCCWLGRVQLLSTVKARHALHPHGTLSPSEDTTSQNEQTYCETHPVQTDTRVSQ
jgi:hypothetical protein